MAAPVGQARTQAGPELNSLHMSHLTAFLGMFLSFACFSMPGSVPIPNNNQSDKLGLLRFGFTGAIWITPYGQLCSQLPQPMQRVADEHLAVPRAVDGVRRAILHAVRMLAMPAGSRHVDLGVGRAGFAIESRGAVMGVRAGLLAVVAANAQGSRRSAVRRSPRRRLAAPGS